MSALSHGPDPGPYEIVALKRLFTAWGKLGLYFGFLYGVSVALSLYPVILIEAYMGSKIQAVVPVLGATDVEALVRFYDRLGFAVVFQDAPRNPKYVAVRRDGVELHIQWADKGQWAYPIDRPAFRFVVTDVDEIYQEFVKSGGVHADASEVSPWASPKDTPWGTREFHLRDLSQNSLQFYRPL